MQPIPRCKRMVPATGSSSPAEERNIHHLADKSSNWQSIVRHSFCNDGTRCHGVARCGAADNRRIVWHGVCKCRGSSSRPNIVPGLVGDLFFRGRGRCKRSTVAADWPAVWRGSPRLFRLEINTALDAPLLRRSLLK